MKRIILPLILVLSLVLVSPVTSPATAAQPTWSVYFSPNGGCTEAIVKELGKAKSTILVQSYSFTSTPIAKALVDVHKRGLAIVKEVAERHHGRAWVEAGTGKGKTFFLLRFLSC